MTTHLPSLQSQLQDVTQMIIKGDDSVKVINKKIQLEAAIACIKSLTERKYYHTLNQY